MAKNKSEALTEYLHISVSPVLKIKLEQLASDDRRTFNAYVRMVLEDHVEKETT